MPFGITNITTVTMDNLTAIGSNITDPVEFIINVNDIIYGGIMVFVLLWVGAIILYMALQDHEEQPLINAMYSLAVITVLSFFYRAIEIVKNGVTVGLLTDYQMWIFPLLTILLATFLWITRER